MTETIQILIAVSLFSGGIISGVACFHLAYEKGYSGCSASLVGFFLGLFGLITYAGLPDKVTQNTLIDISNQLAYQQSQATLQRCHECGAKIGPGSRYCNRCGNPTNGRYDKGQS